MPSRFSRRRLAAGALASAGSLALPSTRARGQDQQEVLRILGWPSYFTPELTAAFQKANNCRLEVTPIGTPDDTMLFLRAGGVGFYDIAVPSIGLVDPLGAAGLLAELDATAIPSFGGLFPQFQALPAESMGRRYGIPMIWGTLALVYAPDELAGPPAAWMDLQDAAFARSLIMPDDGLGHFWIWNWALGAQDPTRVSIGSLDRTTNLLIQLKRRQAQVFAASNYDAMMQVANGRGSVATVGWQMAPLLTTSGQRTLATALPDPGGASFCDCIALVAGSHDPELAQAFIAYMLNAETQRDLIDATRWATVAREAPPMIQPDIAALYDYDQLDQWLARAPVRGYPPVTDDGSGLATYLDWVLAWDRVRQARF